MADTLNHGLKVAFKQENGQGGNIKSILLG